ncbi:MAG: hypothetical protein ACLQPD_11945 [Desulfomonilaceae bacterium]
MAKTGAQRRCAEFEKRLERCKTADELIAWSEDLINSRLLDESEQTKWMTPIHGFLAPRSFPTSATVIKDDGENVTIRMASGEIVTWDNPDREWLKTAE